MFEFLRKNKKGNEKPNIADKVQNINKFNAGDNKYYYEVDNDAVHLEIGNCFDENNFKDMYVCNLEYVDYGMLVIDYDDHADVIGFKNVVIELDKGRMVNDTKYAEFVLKNLLNRNRIGQLRDIAVGIVSGERNGVYVGSVIDKDGVLSISMDNEKGKNVANSELTKSALLTYKNFKDEVDNFKAAEEERNSKSRLEKIEYLKEELAALQKEENNYQERQAKK